MFGGLVLISGTYFQDFHIAVIRDKQKKNMDIYMRKFGYVQICVEIWAVPMGWCTTTIVFKIKSSKWWSARCISRLTIII